MRGNITNFEKFKTVALLSFGILIIKYCKVFPTTVRRSLLMLLVTMASVIWVLFVEFFVPLEKFPLIWKRHHYRWRTSKFDLCSALMVIEQWELLRVPHQLWYGASICNGHIGGTVRVTRTPVAERLTVELSLSDYTT